MKRAVVTGVTSMIGVALVNELINSNFEVIGVVRPKSKNINRLIKNDNLKIIESDMSDYSGLLDKINTHCDIFFHLAWEGARRPYRDNENIQKNNYNSKLQALKVAKSLECSKTIGSGSQAEYGSCDGYEKETDECNPSTLYGKYKLKACMDGQAFARNNGMEEIV